MNGSPVALLVDDDPPAEWAHELARIDASLRAVRRARCDDALSLVRDGVVPRLVILNSEAPRREGSELLDWVRSDPRFRLTAVVVAGDVAADPSRERWLPGEVWLPKPFAIDDLVTAIRLALSRSIEGDVGGSPRFSTR